MNTFRYKIEKCQNPQIIVIHTRVVIPRANAVDAFASMAAANEHDWMVQSRHPLYNALAAIDGIETASPVSGYDLRLSKAELFSWDEILPSVLKAIQKHLADGAEMTEDK